MLIKYSLELHDFRKLFKNFKKDCKTFNYIIRDYQIYFTRLHLKIN